MNEKALYELKQLECVCGNWEFSVQAQEDKSAPKAVCANWPHECQAVYQYSSSASRWQLVPEQSVVDKLRTNDNGRLAKSSKPAPAKQRSLLERMMDEE